MRGMRRTSGANDDPSYVRHRINGIQPEVVTEGIRLTSELQDALLPMIRLLPPQDFERLVYLVFTGSGWRRHGVVGRTQNTVGMELRLPMSNESAVVQVRPNADQASFDEVYLNTFNDMGAINRMFFVCHTGSVECSDERVTLIGPDKLPRMVLDAGLVSWLIEEVR